MTSKLTEKPPKYQEDDENNDEDLFNISSEENRIPKEEIIKLQRKFRLKNEYSLEESKTRNILLVGRTRSGKSTVIGVLKDPCHEPKDMSIFSDTVDPKFQSFSLDDKVNKTKYTLNLIDTPGLKEVKAIGEKARTDQMITDAISCCLKNEITKINVLLVLISFELGVTQDDVDSFQIFLEKFKHDDISIAICITRSEDKNPQWKENMIKQLKEHPYFSVVLSMKNVFVCFMGCVDAVKSDTINNIDDLRKLYAKVYQMRAEALKLIFSSEKQVRLIDLPIASGKKGSLKEIFAVQNEILDYLSAINDFGTSSAKLKIDDFKTNIEYLAQNDAYLYDEEMHELFVKMKERMKPITKKMDEPTRLNFVGSLIL